MKESPGSTGKHEKRAASLAMARGCSFGVFALFMPPTNVGKIRKACLAPLGEKSSGLFEKNKDLRHLPEALFVS